MTIATARQAQELRKEIKDLSSYIFSISPRLARHGELKRKRAILQKKLDALSPQPKPITA